MEYRISDLRYKEVISVKSGQRFGYVYDAIVDIENCKLIALVVPGSYRFFGLVGREEDFIFPCSCIVRISEEIILVDSDHPSQRSRKSRRGRF
jgi:YlmC/YmxH family sporulation protein